MKDKLMKLLENDRFAAFVGIELVKVQPGFAVAKMDISEKHMNGVNIIQGGAIFTLADFAFAAASNACGQITVGINANISYFKASKGKILIAEAKEVSVSQKIANFNVDVFNENKDHIAQLSITGFKKSEKADKSDIYL
ncbi:MAG: PaaI family thioesterase [Bacillota bacterium]|nr:PaaI family thioesterase [Bacillota bacterium]MDP4160963.1 PaaI family thioesterase [Bacillota bacterium]